MADTTANINLITAGGDAAAAEIGKASGALNQVAQSSSQMQSQFQERFQHIGLSIFAGQALQSIGLSGETRQAVLLMNTAIIAAESAADIASGGFTLLLTALVAIGAVIYKVMEGHKAEITSLNQLHDATQQQITSTDNDIETIQNYIKAGGAVTPALQSWLNSSIQLRKALIQEQIATDQNKISTLQAAIADAEASKGKLTLVQSLELAAAATLKDFGAQQLAASMISKAANSIEAQNIVLAQNKAALADAIVELQKLEQGGTKTFGQLTQDAEKNKQATIDAIHQQTEAAHQYFQHYESEADKLKAYVKKMSVEQAQEVKKQNKEMMKSFDEAAMTMGKDFGSAFAQVIVQGGNMADAMTQAAQKMAEQFVESTIEMIIYWTALRAIMSVLPGGAAAFQTSSQAAYPAISSMMYGQAASNAIPKQALGGSLFADQPTLAMFGEAGPELATFSPMGSSGATSSGGAGASSGGGTMNNEINITIQGGMVDQNTISKIGQYIVQTIRGQGQIAFT